LNGLENISANDGWAIALMGVSIVFIGLILLSLCISQLHKIIDFWENIGKDKDIHRKKYITPPRESTAFQAPVLDEESETIRQYKVLVDRLEQPFSLTDLLEFAERVGLYNPHSTINYLLEKKIIIPDKNGYFIWTRQ